MIVFSSFVSGTIIDPFNVSINIVSVTKLPALNGLGISAGRGDFDVNGSVPMHFHPDATELLIMVKGELTVGFITPTKVYIKTVKPGAVIVFPIGLLHFVVNLVMLGFSSSNPSILDYLLFGNNLPTSIIQQTTKLDLPQIMKLKAQFGGSG